MQMFALVLLFGLFHGLMFLPVLLSLVGPQSEDNSKRHSEDYHDRANGLHSVYNNKAFKDTENNLALTIDSKNAKNTKF